MITAKYPVSKRAHNWGIFTVELHQDEVWRALFRLDTATSAPGLAVYMHDFVSPYFEDQIVDRFAYEGDAASGPWLPLEASTIRIRRALGYSDDEINDRTGELLDHVAFGRRYQPIGGDTFIMDIPGIGGTDFMLNRKLITAQRGRVQGSTEMLPGAYTPPRPVLALDSGDVMAVLRLAQMFVVQWMTGFIAPGINVGSAGP